MTPFSFEKGECERAQHCLSHQYSSGFRDLNPAEPPRKKGSVESLPGVGVPAIRYLRSMRHVQSEVEIPLLHHGDELVVSRDPSSDPGWVCAQWACSRRYLPPT